MSGRKGYWVDWSDHAFPEIRPASDATEYATIVTFAEAKAEIINHFQTHIDHARAMIQQTRALRTKNIESRL